MTLHVAADYGRDVVVHRADGKWPRRRGFRRRFAVVPDAASAAGSRRHGEPGPPTHDIELWYEPFRHYDALVRLDASPARSEGAALLPPPRGGAWRRLRRLVWRSSERGMVLATPVGSTTHAAVVGFVTACAALLGAATVAREAVMFHARLQSAARRRRRREARARGAAVARALRAARRRRRLRILHAGPAARAGRPRVCPAARAARPAGAACGARGGVGCGGPRGRVFAQGSGPRGASGGGRGRPLAGIRRAAAARLPLGAQDAAALLHGAQDAARALARVASLAGGRTAASGVELAGRAKTRRSETRRSETQRSETRRSPKASPGRARPSPKRRRPPKATRRRRSDEPLGLAKPRVVGPAIPKRGDAPPESRSAVSGSGEDPKGWGVRRTLATSA